MKHQHISNRGSTGKLTQFSIDFDEFRKIAVMTNGHTTFNAINMESGGIVARG